MKTRETRTRRILSVSASVSVSVHADLVSIANRFKMDDDSDTLKELIAFMRKKIRHMEETENPVYQEKTDKVNSAIKSVTDLFDKFSSKLNTLKERLKLMESDASASSSTVRTLNYDVFLSFRGPDTRKGVTFELYDRLQNRGIETFKDDRDLEVGDDISPTLLKAIKESRFAIVVLSPNYASSTWCLEELAKICECKENNKILPLFYNVDPGDVRHQQKSFGDAFTKHEGSGRHRPDMVQQWRNALTKVADLSGWDAETYKTDRQLVEHIVEFVYSKVQPTKINLGDFQEFEATRQAINEEVFNAIGENAVEFLKLVGNSHWVMVGLSLVAFAVDKWLISKSNIIECKEIINTMLDLATNISDLRDALRLRDFKDDDLQEILRKIVENIIICDAQFSENSLFKFIKAKRDKENFENLRKEVATQFQKFFSIGLSATAKILARTQVDIPSLKWPTKRGVFSVGIDQRIEDVIKLLEMDNEDPLQVVNICGFGGVGKSHLAGIIVEKLAEREDISSNYSYCDVTVLEQGNKIHIAKLQGDIMSAFEGKKQEVRATDRGREQITNVLSGKTSFIYIDNIVKRDDLRELLPRLIDIKANTKIRILITSREGQLDSICRKVHYTDFHVETLDFMAGKSILLHQILEGQDPDDDEEETFIDDEEDRFIDKLVEASKGVPLILSSYGQIINHRRQSEGLNAYKDAISALKECEFDNFASEEVGKTLMFVYDALKEEWKETFLDICFFFHGWNWYGIAPVLQENTLKSLVSYSLISRSLSGQIHVHDIYLAIGQRKGKGTRFRNDIEWLKEKTDLHLVKGLCLNDSMHSYVLEASDLKGMSSALRVLILGDTVFISEPCRSKFENIIYLETRRLKGFPFYDLSQAKNLRGFANCSTYGNDLHKIKVKSCEKLQMVDLAVQNLAKKNAESYVNTWGYLSDMGLRTLSIVSETKTTLPSNFSFPSSLEALSVNNFGNIPSISHLRSLQALVVNQCDMKHIAVRVPCKIFPVLTKLDMTNCFNLEELPENFDLFFKNLKVLVLDGCVNLKALPKEIGSVECLQTVDISGCRSLTVLPDSFASLHGLRTFKFKNCTGLQEMPNGFSPKCISQLVFSGLSNLTQIPPSIGEMSGLQSFTLQSCHKIKFFPVEFSRLKQIRRLNIEQCSGLVSLLTSIGSLKSLKILKVLQCPNLRELPDDMGMLNSLQVLYVLFCSKLRKIPESFENLVSLERLFFRALPQLKYLPRFPKHEGFILLDICEISQLTFLPGQFESLQVHRLIINLCPSVPSYEMDRILKLPNCYSLIINGSTMLEERWEQIKQQSVTSCVVNDPDFDDPQWQPFTRTALLSKPLRVRADDPHRLEECHLSLSGKKYIAVILFSSEWDISEESAKQIQMAVPPMAFEKQNDIVFILNLRPDRPRKNEASLLEWLPKGWLEVPTSDLRRRGMIFYIFRSELIKLREIHTDCVCCILDVDEVESSSYIFSNRRFGSSNDVLFPQRETVSNSRHQISHQDASPLEPVHEVEKLMSSTNRISTCMQIMKTQYPRKFHSRYCTDIQFFVETLKQKDVHFLVNKHRKEMNVEDVLQPGELIVIIEGNFNERSSVAVKWLTKDMPNVKIVVLWYWKFIQGISNAGKFGKVITDMPESFWSIPCPLSASHALLQCVTFCGEDVKASTVYNLGDELGRCAWIFGLNYFCDSERRKLLGPNRSHAQELIQSLNNKIAWELLIGEPRGKSVPHRLTFLYNRRPSSHNDVWPPIWPRINLETTLQKMLEELLKKFQQGQFVILYVGDRVIQSEEQYNESVSEMPWNSLSFSESINMDLRMPTLLKNEMLISEVLGIKVWWEAGELALLEDGKMVMADAKYMVDTLLETGMGSNNVIVKEEMRKSLENGKLTKFCKEMAQCRIKHPVDDQHLLFLSNITSVWPCNLCAANETRNRTYACRVCETRKVLCGECWETYLLQQMKFDI